MEKYEAVTVAVSTTDTLYRVADGCEADIPRRADYKCAQTPQAFRLDVIARAYDLALQSTDFQATDDCGVVRCYMPDIPIHIVFGEAANRKITYKEDM